MLREWKASGLLLLLAGGTCCAAWLTYKQIQIDELEMVESKLETSQYIAEIQEYKRTSHNEIEKQLDKIGKDIKNLKLVSKHSTSRTVSSNDRNVAQSSFKYYSGNDAETFFFDCLDILSSSHGTDGNKRMFCLGQASDRYPYDDFTKITNYTSSF